ncbi:dihydrofolate reductase-like domain-containing protein [Fimicolochytrium jonesii]|uniref:dihydrofolate reductase-like domain-containing protein n=1 Tax=Fimicolochytrium jonesii TaxID=1396493 RepID=UPI0022FE8F70|nr:dihydrofolate reductase-like domain-containing protein [Fimicolochytrium jonesii]KAI8821371.1 dihydrofolate reductase-like domain-containing protein [Fimicolochytrium jonesii]
MATAPPDPTRKAEEEAYAFLRPHLPPMSPAPHNQEQLPFLTLTYAQSLDGFIAGPQKRPLTLSSPNSMTLTHALRASHDAILVGVDTVINDDPSLTTRLVLSDASGNEARHPQPIILDSTLRTPVSAKLLSIDRGDARKPLIVTTRVHDPVRRHELTEKGVQILVVGDTEGGPRVSIRNALAVLATGFNIRSVMVEGGATVIGSLLTSMDVAIDKLIVTVAPVAVGNGVHAIGAQETMAAGGGLLPKFSDVQWKQFGPDAVMVAKVEK